ncbi:multidrug resistance efflux transporter family protein [Caldalkalibacillus salinus]|uniref:DMT family transporter n=1 Tax=Caldalkalibacillus salinus TaxID=2803787 RepID=UPI001920B90C|nr:multidrug resistance efflux transporter family protein [Caldalkalibacillus salinus]
MKDIFIGILASMFFAVTFILNRSMELSGGSWLWSSSLRYLFMLPFLFLIVLCRRNLKQVFAEMRTQPLQWLLWSFVGFVLFYAPITYAAAYGPGWLVAGTWPMTIVAGILLGPLFFETVQSDNGPIKVRHQIPVSALLVSLLILCGVMLIQWQHAQDLTVYMIMAGILPVAIAAFAYPLGNRKMMALCAGRLDTFQRVLGMTIASLPFWLIIGAWGWRTVGAPSADQVLQSFIVAICSGVIATTLFFIATDRVRDHQGKLAAVEATQSTQVVFVIIGEVLLLSSPLPHGLAIGGLLIIVLGMLLHSFLTKKVKPKITPSRGSVRVGGDKEREQHVSS